MSAGQSEAEMRGAACPSRRIPFCQAVQWLWYLTHSSFGVLVPGLFHCIQACAEIGSNQGLCSCAMPEVCPGFHLSETTWPEDFFQWWLNTSHGAMARNHRQDKAAVRTARLCETNQVVILLSISCVFSPVWGCGLAGRISLGFLFATAPARSSASLQRSVKQLLWSFRVLGFPVSAGQSEGCSALMQGRAQKEKTKPRCPYDSGWVHSTTTGIATHPGPSSRGEQTLF